MAIARRERGGGSNDHDANPRGRPDSVQGPEVAGRRGGAQEQRPRLHGMLRKARACSTVHAGHTARAKHRRGSAKNFLPAAAQAREGSLAHTWELGGQLEVQVEEEQQKRKSRRGPYPLAVAPAEGEGYRAGMDSEGRHEDKGQGSVGTPRNLLTYLTG